MRAVHATVAQAWLRRIAVAFAVVIALEGGHPVRSVAAVGGSSAARSIRSRLPGKGVSFYGAASLRAPLTAISVLYTRQTHERVKLHFGASGRLESEITAHAVAADIFASADVAKPKALVAAGLAKRVVRFARILCAR